MATKLATIAGECRLRVLSESLGNGTPAKIPAYRLLDLAGDWYITKHCKLITGISNLTDEKCYFSVFFFGQIEPAPRRLGLRWHVIGVLNGVFAISRASSQIR